jgi:hypothetical protein
VLLLGVTVGLGDFGGRSRSVSRSRWKLDADRQELAGCGSAGSNGAHRVYADITGDGADEVVVAVACGPSTAEIEIYELRIFDVQITAGGAEPKLIAVPPASTTRDGGSFRLDLRR